MSFKTFLKRATPDDAVYWPKTGETKYGANTFGNPVAIKCRWEDYVTDFVDREGKILVSTARIFLTCQIAFGGMLWRGKCADLVDQVDPQNNPNALEVRSIRRQPSFKNNVILWIAMC